MRRKITLAVAAVAWLAGFASATFIRESTSNTPASHSALVYTESAPVSGTPLDAHPRQAPASPVQAADRGRTDAAAMDAKKPPTPPSPDIESDSPAPVSPAKRALAEDAGDEDVPTFYGWSPEKIELAPGSYSSSFEDKWVHVPSGEVTFRGDLRCEYLTADPGAVVILEGDQILNGQFEAYTLILRGGTKRMEWGYLSADDDDDGEEAAQRPTCIVEQGTTLVLEECADFGNSGAGSFQVGGAIVIDGGEFSFRLYGDTEIEHDYWLPGSSLTLNSGCVDIECTHDFDGATVAINGGEVTVDGDILGVGDRFTINDGLVRNSEKGGLFCINGVADINGGTLKVFQCRDLGLRFGADALVNGKDGVVEIRGEDAASPASGILLRGTQFLPVLDCYVSTRIHRDSDLGGQLHISELYIEQYKEFDAKGCAVFVAYEATEEDGEFVP